MVILKALGKVWEITKYVDKPIKGNDGLTGLKDTAEITMVGMKGDELEGIDLTRKIPRYAIVEIEGLMGTKNYFVENSTVTQKGLLWEHTLKLAEPKIINKNRPIPDFSITQAIDDIELYVFEASRLTTKRAPIGNNNIIYTTLDFAISQVSNDPNKIDGRKIEETGYYDINFEAVLGMVLGTGRIKKVSLYIDLLVNGMSVKTPFSKYWEKPSYNDLGSVGFNENIHLNKGQTIGVRMGVIYTTTLNDPNPDYDVDIKSGSLTIRRNILEEAPDIIHMDNVAEKVVRLFNITGNTEYILDPVSKAKLSQIVAYEEMQTETNLEIALERIASFARARLYIDLVDELKVVRFEFYDDMSKQEYHEPNDESEIINAPSNDYFSGLALKNNNILKNNHLTEKIYIMSGSLDNRQINTNDVATFTKQAIDTIDKVIIEGFSMGGITEIDISDRILEKTHYDTLDNMANYDNRLFKNKNNHLYYIRGENKIYGMSFIGNQFDKWEENKSNRALWETIACAIAEKTATTPTKYVDKGLAKDMELTITITYTPISETHAVIHKDDQTGFEQKLISNLNANDRMNHIDYLGTYAKGLINSIGGTEKSKRGIARYGDNITTLGTVSPDNERVVNITWFDYGEYVEYYVTLVKDYIFRSHYIGIDRDRRLLHVPKDQYVKRVDKSLNVLYFDTEENWFNNTSVRVRELLKILKSTYSYPPSVAVMNFDGNDYTLYVDVNAAGNTIEWYVEAQDNFSIGMQRLYNSELDIYYQKGVAYGNLFGNVNNVRVRFYDLLYNITNQYPLGNLVGEGWAYPYGDITYQLEKDAREQFALSFQTSIVSNSDQIYVYDGFAKYNSVRMPKQGNIIFAALHYVPNMDDKYIDIGRITQQKISNINTMHNGKIIVKLEVDAMGYAWYHKDTKELILAYVGDIEKDENYYLYYNLDKYDTVTSEYEKTGIYQALQPEIVKVEYKQTYANEYTLYLTIINRDDEIAKINYKVEGLRTIDSIYMSAIVNSNETKEVEYSFTSSEPLNKRAKVFAYAQVDGKEDSERKVVVMRTTEKE